MMSDNQSAKRKRKQSIKDLRCSENATNGFKESLEPSWDFINVFLDDGKKRLTRGMLQKLIEQAMVDEETSNRDDQDVSIIECGSKPSLPLQQISQKKKLRSSLNKKKNRSSIILINNDLSDGHSADMHESIQSSSNGENIAPQMEDDIVELWSSLKTNNKGKKNTFKKRKCNKMNNETSFVIDTKPDFKNLNRLKMKSANKRRKLYHKNDNAAMAHNPFVMQVTSKDVKQRQRTKQHYNDIDSNIKLTKVQSHKKETKKNKKCPALSQVSSSATSLVRNLASSSTQNAISTLNKLREIVVDGSNVAMAYTHHKEFAEKGIQLVVDYFMTRGHIVKVFLPLHIRRKRYSFLEEMYEKGVVVFTPSRKILGRQITPYDDRYILEYATLCNGIVISADQYRDLYQERPEWRDTIENRLLTPTFVGDRVMFPEDPLGRSGPDLHTFLRH
ncbi:uncharacterized protein [Linepithema humile]|uniref:uncharacterized protein isoform X2 n=1 Tax=Linepithema humile TaxID=83485 RepID=UPI000623617F|nr:PREDICTED: uncharacterized protein LOC105667561 isoform X2 [Linepithema humile]